MKKLILGLMVGVMMGVGALGVTQPVNAADAWNQACSDVEAGLQNEAGCGDIKGSTNISKVIQNILYTVLGIAGVLAVVAIIIGGQRMITAGGDPGKVKSAKDILMQALIGLAVVILAWAIVSLVVGMIAA